MSTLSSLSTLAEIKAAYADNAGYREDDSPTKAAAFVTACRILLLRIPAMVTHGGKGMESTEFRSEVLQAELREAQRWVSQRNAATSSVRFADLTNFRG